MRLTSPDHWDGSSYSVAAGWLHFAGLAKRSTFAAIDRAVALPLDRTMLPIESARLCPFTTCSATLAEPMAGASDRPVGRR
jgi:hypothetical protein